MARRNKAELADMTEAELAEVVEAESKAAAKVARAHVMRAWEAAVRAGHRGSFDEWLALAMPEHLRSEAQAVAEGVPQGVRQAAAHSPWYRSVG